MMRNPGKYMGRVIALALVLGIAGAAVSRFAQVPVVIALAAACGLAGAVAPFLFKDVKMG